MTTLAGPDGPISDDVVEEVSGELLRSEIAPLIKDVKGIIDDVGPTNILCIRIYLKSLDIEDKKKALEIAENIIVGKMPEKIPIRDDTWTWSVSVLNTDEDYKNNTFLNTMGGYLVANSDD